MKYLLKASDNQPATVIDGDSLHRFIEAARAYVAASENLPEGVPYDVDAAVEVAAISGYVADRLADLIDVYHDVWEMGAEGLMHSYETAPFPPSHVEKKWGPLLPARDDAGVTR